MKQYKKSSILYPQLQFLVEDNEEQMVLEFPEKYSHDLSSSFSYSNLDHVDFVLGDLWE